MRETARVLECNYKTVFLKFLWLSQRAKEHHLKQKFKVGTILFDEMESLEHTKLKPLTIALAVSDDYQILGVQVGTIPAKGHLAGIALKKYGYRKNESLTKTKALLSQVAGQLIAPITLIKSDAKPSYKSLVTKIFPDTTYEQHLSKSNKEKRREQKYLKSEKHVHDPLFEVNHICAVLRDHIKRLTRRSWCTTKIKQLGSDIII